MHDVGFMPTLLHRGLFLPALPSLAVSHTDTQSTDKDRFGICHPSDAYSGIGD
ncbi:predicted protein [Pyrenophora tritici-repentis Pt-1C-BFP]|uniref:Uncharacterized protein n=1 Tax=Pyrenophora tritici-repentis (strain Pt-1C-BFP) TaxID=426418 RepID=B2W9F0_PYRTR|nr:uncharacterized protein PTRG_06608 [Pyrenophora tritici-repentis Pt-1C-BFP]EDU49528.1 predicted protein [Pyrenophora tritici-repentis Pt-1C-BFP]